jgi:hypothetical protein
MSTTIDMSGIGVGTIQTYAPFFEIALRNIENNWVKYNRNDNPHIGIYSQRGLDENGHYTELKIVSDSGFPNMSNEELKELSSKLCVKTGRIQEHIDNDNENGFKSGSGTGMHTLYDLGKELNWDIRCRPYKDKFITDMKIYYELEKNGKFEKTEFDLPGNYSPSMLGVVFGDEYDSKIISKDEQRALSIQTEFSSIFFHDMNNVFGMLSYSGLYDELKDFNDSSDEFIELSRTKFTFSNGMDILERARSIWESATKVYTELLGNEFENKLIPEKMDIIGNWLGRFEDYQEFYTGVFSKVTSYEDVKIEEVTLKELIKKTAGPDVEYV